MQETNIQVGKLYKKQTNYLKKTVVDCEPSDAIRVVNAVLTQLDQIKSYKNVLILSTSNLSETIDLAFIDRADIKQYLGPPTIPAIYKIYYSCIKELIQVRNHKYH